MHRIVLASVIAASLGTLCAQTATLPSTLVSSSVERAASPVPTPSSCETALPKTIAGKVLLPTGCIYSRELLIAHSNTLLDCNGAIFDGHSTLKVGLNIDSGGKPLEDITVKNCTFQNYSRRGLLIGWSGLDTSKPRNHAFLYSHTPHDIHIDHVTIIDSGRDGLYVDDYVQKVSIEHAVVRGSGATGLYFEHSSRYITLRDSVVSGNGGEHREGLSIDSSAHNVVEGNTFENNTAGGIFLYKNCWELAHKPSQGEVKRWQHSDFNIIRNNVFRHEPIGVWIASRQSMDLTSWDCGDTPMGGNPRFYRDYADDNLVEGNTFCNVKVPIRVEGDRNLICDNRFDRTNRTHVEMPVTQRGQLLHLPPVGNVVSGSKEIACKE